MKAERESYLKHLDEHGLIGGLEIFKDAVAHLGAHLAVNTFTGEPLQV